MDVLADPRPVLLLLFDDLPMSARRPVLGFAGDAEVGGGGVGMGGGEVRDGRLCAGALAACRIAHCSARHSS